MDCCPVSVSLGTQDHRWWFVIDVATLHLHTSGLHMPFLLSRTRFHCFLSTLYFTPKSGSNVITPHLLRQNNSLPFLFPRNDLFIFRQFYVIVYMFSPIDDMLLMDQHFAFDVFSMLVACSEHLRTCWVNKWLSTHLELKNGWKNLVLVISKHNVCLISYQLIIGGIFLGA